MRPPGLTNPEHERLGHAMPWALSLARTIARRLGVRARERIEDCEQTAFQALLEALPGYDSSRGPFETYAWKWVAGAVTRLVRRERSYCRTGLDDALDAAEDIRDVSDVTDPFTDDDDLDQLRSYCRWLTFVRFMGDTRAKLTKDPENMLLRAQTFEALERSFGALDKAAKKVLALRYWVGLTWPQIGLAMGKTERQIKRIDKQLRRRLQRDLRIRGIEEEPPSE